MVKSVEGTGFLPVKYAVISKKSHQKKKLLPKVKDLSSFLKAVEAIFLMIVSYLVPKKKILSKDIEYKKDQVELSRKRVASEGAKQLKKEGILIVSESNVHRFPKDSQGTLKSKIERNIVPVGVSMTRTAMRAIHESGSNYFKVLGLSEADVVDLLKD